MWKFDEFNDSKARNRLSLEERVKAIREYEKTPNYSKVGLMFKCSSKQIRNIISRKDEILALYESFPSLRAEAKKPSSKRRRKKIQLLSMVMHEWFLRARRNPSVCIISYKLIRDTALEVRRILNVENFSPNNAWLMNFREKYNISETDMKIQSEDSGPIDLNIESIISTVVINQKNKQKTGDKEVVDLDSSSNSTDTENKNDADDDSENDGTFDVLTIEDNYVEPSTKYSRLENKQTDVIEIDSDDDDDDDDDVDDDDVDGIDDDDGEQGNKTIIKSIDQALKHLKPLEEFALLRNNYRAIGLISQLESILQSPNKE